MYCLRGVANKIWGFEHGVGRGEEWRERGGVGVVEVVTQSQILPLITTTTSRLL